MTDLRTRIAAAALVTIVGAGTAAAVVVGATAAHAANAAVSATSGNTFEPGRVVINVNDTVTWTTTGGVNHTVTSSTPNWKKDDPIPVPGRSTTFQFKAAGQYNYFCKTHGTANSGMRGVVFVSAPPRASAAPTRSPTPRPTATVTRPPSPTPRPAPTRSPAPSASPSRPSPSRSASPTPVVVTAPPIGLPSSRPAPPTASAVPLPTVADVPSDAPSDPPTVDLGSGGLGPRPTTGRGRGLPTFIALVALVGVVSAQVRALLALPTED